MGLFGFGKKRPRSETVVGLYGKHRSAADFLRHNAGSAEVRALDEWLSGALPAAARLVPEWETTYETAPPVHFLLPAADGGRLLVGGLAPSADRSGRLYPLIVFAELDAAQLADRYPSFPLSRFLGEVGALLARRGRLARESLLAAVQDLRPPDAASLADADAQRAAFLDGTTAEQAFGAMFAQAPATDGVSRAVATLREACGDVAPGRPRPGFGVRCPLGGASAKHASHVTVWLALAERLLPRATLPSALWSEGSLLLYFGRLPAKALAVLWHPEFQDDSLYDLLRPTSAEGEKLPLGEPLRGLLAAVGRR
jgi:type VI secretion system ImpM family protein